MAKAQDPREIITPDAFSVARELLGLPLAHPWRRAAAILIDLALIGLLANAKGVLLALAGGAFLFWIAFRGRKAGLGSTLARGTVGCAGAVFVFVAVIAIWGTVFFDEDTKLFDVSTGEGQSVPVTLGTVGDLGSVLGSEDSVEAEAAATRILRRLEEEGVPAGELRTAVQDLELGENDATARAIERALDAVTPAQDQAVPGGLDLDSLLAAYGEARARGDTLTEREVGPALGRLLAADDWNRTRAEVHRLEDRSDRLSAELEETERALEEERNRGLIATIMGFLDELGLGIGWSGLYFTFLTAFFRGRTPGKRLLGIRVLRLDGSGLSYWVAFERFGGYAASLFTGMEGFFRILWDRNRQCLQDKLAETVVIRETRDARAQLAVGAAKRAMSDQPWKGSPITGN